MPCPECSGLHGCTFATGLFATKTAPGSEINGLFYGGGFKLLGIQFTGMLCTALWTAITITITFLVIKKTVGLRVTAEEEIAGLDATEHGLESAYSGFVISDSVNTIGDSALAAIAASAPEPEEKKEENPVKEQTIEMPKKEADTEAAQQEEKETQKKVEKDEDGFILPQKRD